MHKNINKITKDTINYKIYKKNSFNNKEKL